VDQLFDKLLNSLCRAKYRSQAAEEPNMPSKPVVNSEKIEPIPSKPAEHRMNQRLSRHQKKGSSG